MNDLSIRVFQFLIQIYQCKLESIGISKVNHLCPDHHPKRTDDRRGRRSIWIDVIICEPMGDVTVEGVISGLRKTKNYFKMENQYYPDAWI
jgi:hypothetical protein